MLFIWGCPINVGSVSIYAGFNEKEHRLNIILLAWIFSRNLSNNRFSGPIPRGKSLSKFGYNRYFLLFIGALYYDAYNLYLIWLKFLIGDAYDFVACMLLVIVLGKIQAFAVELCIRDVKNLSEMENIAD